MYELRKGIWNEPVSSRMCIDWDEQISEDIVTRWFSWLCVLTNVVSFRIPNSLSPDLINAERIKHHLFADASEDTFAVSAYLRISRTELDTCCHENKFCSTKRVENLSS